MRSLRLLLLGVAAATAASGLVQAVAPSFVLGVIGAEAGSVGSYAFGIVGMFMVLFGGLLWEGLPPRGPIPLALRWAGLQKLGAAGAVGLGVMRGLFGPLALGVAGFDLLSGVLIFVYLYRSR